MELSSLRRMSAADEAFKALHDMIMSGRLKHGDKLPPQDQLARQFGVSRNTVREAINKLTVMGMLTAKQGIGTLINITSPSSYMASLSDHLILQPATVRDFMEARIVIEAATVRLAVIRADEQVLVDLENNIRMQKEALRKGRIDDFVPLDVEFHIKLSEASGNKVLSQFLCAVTDLLSKFIKEVSLLPRAVQNALSFHRDILRLIRAKDVEAAELKIIEHLYDVLNNVEQSTGMEVGTAFPFKR